jgi:hypothetical protein
MTCKEGRNLRHGMLCSSSIGVEEFTVMGNGFMNRRTVQHGVSTKYNMKITVIPIDEARQLGTTVSSSCMHTTWNSKEANPASKNIDDNI